MIKSSSNMAQNGHIMLLDFGLKLLFALLVGLILKAQVEAQPIDSYRYLAQNKNQRGFDVDFQWIQATKDSTLLAVFLSIPNQQLAFERQAGSSYSARYVLNLEIYKGFYEDENTRELAERLVIGDTIVVSEYESTLDPNETNVVLTTLYLPVDKYTIHMDYNYLKGIPAVTGVRIDSKKLERLNPNRRKPRANNNRERIFKQYVPKQILREIGLQLYPPNSKHPLYFFNNSKGDAKADISFTTEHENTVVTWVGSTNQINFSDDSFIGIPTFAIDSLSNIDFVISTASSPDNVVRSKTVEITTLPKFTMRLPLSNQLIEHSQTIQSQFYLIDLESKMLANKSYKLELQSKKTRIDSFNFQTFWQDMPTSLLQLDVAIEMLRYIIPKETVDEVLKKKNAEKLSWFNSFWDSKDPIPTTAKNELMSEYYRRIDYSFKHFSTASQPEGYDSDQGQIYIKIGPPSQIIRSFPTSGRVIEEWIYPNRSFVFTASSGFGDFTLVNATEEN